MNQLVILDLIHNQDYYKSIVKDLTEQLPNLLAKEDASLHDEVKKNYKELVKSRWTEDIAKRLLVGADEAMMVLENLNLEEYLK